MPKAAQRRRVVLEVNWLRLVGALTVACAVLVHPNRAGAEQGAPAATPKAVPPAAAAPLPTVIVSEAGPASGLFGSTVWGGRGIHRVVSGFGAPSQALVLSGSTGYSNVHNVFLDGDRNSRSSQSLALAYAPIQGLEISASYSLMVNSYSGLVKRNLEAQGNPALRVKYGHVVRGPVALGLQLTGSMPTSAQGRGLAARATSGEVLALVSWQAHPRIEVTGNIGYLWDRSNGIFSGDSADVLQRYAYQINRVNAVPYGLGAQGRITLGRVVDLQPFVELTGALGLGQGASLKNDPIRISPGLKIYPTRSQVLELALGVDVALGGRPQGHSPFGGQPSWELFAHLHMHLGQMLKLTKDRAPVPDAAPLSQMAKVFGDPSGDMATFRLRGKVLDADSSRPVFGARVMVGEAEDVLLATEDQTGAFRSWPIAAGSGLIRITAKALGYVDDERLLPRPKANEEVELTFSLKADLAKQRLATLRGTFKDARTGRAIASGTVRIDALNLEATVDKAGRFTLQGKPGRYRITFVAPRYQTLERTLTLRPDETLLFNAELRPAANAS